MSARMIDFGLLNTTGDIDLSTGDLVLVSGRKATAQVIGTRFRFQTGEWFLDLSKGAPIIGGLLGADRPHLDDMRDICTQIVEEAPGVVKMTNLDIDLSANRALTVTWAAEGTDGEFLSGKENLTFEDPPEVS